MNRKTSLRSAFFLFVGSSLLALIAAELFLTWLGPTSWRERRYCNHCNVTHWDERYVEFDPELGQWHKRHLDVPFENPEFSTTIRTNSWGFRDDEESLDDPEILVLGDSFTFGWGVEEEETASAVLERLSDRRVLNMGSAGFGTVQQWTLLQRFCESEEISDATVVIQYYMNDRYENFQPPRGVWPTVRKRSTHLVFVPADQDAWERQIETFAPSWKTWASRRSGVLDLVVGTFLNPRRWTAFGGLALMKREVELDEPTGIPIGSFEVLEYVLRVLRRFAEERSLQVNIVFVPFLEQFENPDTELDYATEKRILESLGIPFIDPTDRFEKRDFHRLDRHLNARGQRKLGEAVAEFIEDADRLALFSPSSKESPKEEGDDLADAAPSEID